MTGHRGTTKAWRRTVLLGATLMLAMPAGWIGTANAADASAPAISYATEGVDEGGVFILTGDNFSADTQVYLYRPSKDDAANVKATGGGAPVFVLGQPPQSAVKATVIGKPESHMLAVGQIGYPNQEQHYGAVPTYVWVRTSAGWSKPYLLNKPELYFASSATALPGEKFRLFGRNLSTKFEIAGPDYDYPIKLTNRKTGKVYWAQALMEEVQEQAYVKPYVMNAMLPKDIAPGAYEVAIHTLYGGAKDWSNTVVLNVAASRDLIGSLAADSSIKLATPAATAALDKTSIDKVGGLNADGIHDDADKIQKAIDKMAAKGGGVVLLPAGNLAISKTIRVKPGVVLGGAGKSSTQLVVSPAKNLDSVFPVEKTMFASTAWVKGFAGDYGPYLKDRAPMVWLDNKTGLQDLSVLTGAGADIGVLVANDNPQTIVTDTFIKRTDIENRHMLLFPPGDWWSAYMGGVLVVSATEGFTMTDNKVVGDTSLFMLSGVKAHEHARISNNDFETAVNNSSDTVFANSLADSIFENNNITNGGRGFTSQMGMWRNFISGNVITHTGGRANGSEMLMSEDGYVKPLSTGKALGATADTVQVAGWTLKANEITTTAVEYYAFVVSGPGTGQYRKIIGNAADGTLKLDQPWNIVPDKTSRVDVIRGAVKNLFVNNWISDSRGSLQFSYGAGLDNTVAGNQINNSGSITLFGGIEDWTDSNNPYLAMTAYNNIVGNFLANSGGIFLKGNVGKGHAYGDDVLTDTGGFFANTIRRNQVWAKSMSADINQYYNVWLGGKDKGISDEGAISAKDAAFTVIEGNYISDNNRGVQLSGGKNTVIVNNRMDGVDDRLVELNDPSGIVATPPSWEAPY